MPSGELSRRALLTSVLSLQPLSTRLAPSARLSLPLGESTPGQLHYPPWLEGTWELTNSIRSFSAPLGTALIDPFILASAKEDVQQAQNLRYLMKWRRDVDSPPWCIQDREFNGAQEAAAFLGAMGDLVSCTYDVTPWAPHGHLVLTFSSVDINGPYGAAADTPDIDVEILVKWQRSQKLDSGEFITSEVIQQNVREPGEPDEVTLVESITKFEPPKQDKNGVLTLKARNRLAQYFTGDGKYAAMAQQQAIACFDYDWYLERVKEDRAIGGTDVQKANCI
eukprot:scaffold269497_cov36-Tisochrysis_lutea.AAC.1